MKTFEQFKEEQPKREYYPNGNIKRERWYKEGKQHRETGPAYTWYYENGNIKWESWYKEGKRNRETGPAIIWYYENGNIKWESWYLNGKEYTFEYWLEKLKTINPEQYEIQKKKKEFRDLNI